MKYLTIIFTLLGFSLFAQTDTLYYEVINATNYLVESKTAGSGQITVTKTPIENINATFSTALTEKATAIYDLFRTTRDTEKRVKRLIQENKDVLAVTGQNRLDTIKVAMQDSLVGTWNVLDYNRASTITVTYNAGTGVLKWNGAAGATIVCLSENVIYFRNWLGGNLVLFKQRNQWFSLSKNISLTR
jgi:hypothetical protein